MSKRNGSQTDGIDGVDDEDFEPDLKSEGGASEGTPEYELARSRELTVSTLMHLMGLPSQQQISVIEAKLDSLSSKVTALSSRVDRFSKFMSSVSNEQYLDRIDFQLADLRTLIKKVFPRVAAMEGMSSEVGGDETMHSGQMSLASEPLNDKESK